MQSDDSTQKLVREFVRALITESSDGPDRRLVCTLASDYLDDVY